MAINFPNSPSDGDTHTSGGKTFTYDATAGVWDSSGSGVTEFTGLSDTPSTLGTAGQIAKVNSGGTALEFADQSGVTVYATIDLLPGTANAGDMAFVTATNRLYLWNGSGWYNIALINTNPTISGVSSSYSLATDGTATTVTITATDPEGLPITYSIASDTSGNIATVTQGTGANTNIFTITPSTNNANGGSFSLTFRASDGVNIASSVAEFTLQFAITNSNYTTALVTTSGSAGGNSTFTDSSSNAHTVTANGNVNQTSFSPYRHGGYSTHFDGNGDRLEMPQTTPIGTNDFTIEAWVYPEGFGDTECIFCTIPSGDSTSIQLNVAAAGALELWYKGVSSATDVVSISGVFTLNTWHHIAVVGDGTANEIKIYKDGTQIGSTISYNYNYSASGNMKVGTNRSGLTFFDGYLRDVRVVHDQVYTANFTAPTEPLTAITNTKLLTCHLPYIIDGSSDANAITVYGDTSTQPFGPYDYQEYAVGDHGGSAYFDSSASYLSTPDSDDWYLDGDFTIEFWLYKENSGTFQVPFSQRQGSTSELRLVLDWSTGNAFTPGNIMLEWHAVQILVSGAGVRNEAWNHLVVQRSGTSVYMYLNGYMVHGAQQPSALSNYSASLTIGSYGTNAYDIKGNLTDFRWVKGTAVYSTTGSVGDKIFTPPTAPLTAITNTKLLLNMQGAKIFDKSQSIQSLTLAGNTTASTAQYKYLPTSIYFDGSGDYIRCDDAFSSHTSVNQPYTIEMWSRVDSGAPNATFEALIGINKLSDGNNQLLFSYRNSDYTFHYSGNSVADTGANITVDSWEHIAIVGNDGTNGLAIYVNGTQAYTTSTLLDVPLSDCSILIGAEADAANAGNLGNYYQGYMSDIRFTTGLARYTTSFTPPTAALKG